jgi:hypothetical protein
MVWAFRKGNGEIQRKQKNNLLRYPGWLQINQSPIPVLTSKTEVGAKRRGVIMSVLSSLSKRMEKFTLGHVLAEITRWIETGQSVFREELASLQAATASSSRSPP